ncbi:MAG: cysteine desulfurase NifS [Clostridiaceae bacterium]
MAKLVYMDNSATTFTKPEVLEEMIPYFTQDFGNPSSMYRMSDITRNAISVARDRVAKAINADPKEIFFTAGGSEGDNWALKGIAYANKNKGNHIITTQIEHHAILHSGKYLEKQGFDVTYLPVDSEGFVRLEDLKAAITDKTILVSVMFVNNEIGTVEPIKEIANICKENGIYFHTDAVQAVGHVPIDVKDLGVDMLSLAGHKFHGPKGVGAMFIRKGVKIDNLIHGGAQEKGRRASTENTTGIVGIGKAIEIAATELEEETARLSKLRNKLLNGLLEKIPYAKLNGPKDLSKRNPNNVNMSFIGVEGETLLLDLDDAGICASTGSACASGSLDPSHVLLAIGCTHEVAHGSLRLSLGTTTTEEDVDYALDVIPAIVKRRREMSPLWADFLKQRGEK